MRLFKLFGKKSKSEVSPSSEEISDRLPVNDPSDFITDIAEGFKSLAENLARQGHNFKIDIKAPKISRVQENQIFLKTETFIFSEDNQFSIHLLIEQLSTVGGTGKPHIFAMFPDTAAKSSIGNTDIFYDVINPIDIQSWTRSDNSNHTLETDIIAVANFASVLPDVKLATNFRGIRIEPI